MNAKRKTASEPEAIEIDLSELVPWKRFAQENPHLGTIHSWHWMVVRMGEDNGLRKTGAVVKFKNKLYVNPVQFKVWLARQNGLRIQGSAA